ncbi:MAG: hypothetical protein NVS2B17_00870 [Candidatus Velthaea sp.]
MNVDAHTAERIGAVWLRAALAPAGDFGRRAEDAATLFGPGDEAAARARCARIVALAQTLDRSGVARIRAALRRAPDPQPILSRARAGDTLTDVEFFELGRFVDALDATAETWERAGGEKIQRPPTVPALSALLAPGRTNGAFFLSETFGVALAGARVAYAAADAELQRERARLNAALASIVGFVPDGEEFIVMRDTLALVPPGMRVVRETPAFRTLSVEYDAAALAAASRRESALATLARSEEAARRTLTEALARTAEAVILAVRALGELDRTLARVAFTQRFGGCVPEFAAERFALADATYVPLREAREAESLPYTPISIELRAPAVLTGPNMGGKSAALATCGFIACCVANGVPPPAAAATLPLFGRVAWIGGENAAAGDRLLSAFGNEVVRARDVLADAARPELILVDEFARTTGPREGRALLVAFVEALKSRNSFALAATHFDAVAQDAGVDDFRIAGLVHGGGTLGGVAGDIHAALDAVAKAMDYRIVRAHHAGESRSDALEVAALLGLDVAIVDRARELFGR